MGIKEILKYFVQHKCIYSTVFILRGTPVHLNYKLCLTLPFVTK